MQIDVHQHYLTGELVDALARAGIHDVGGQPLVAWDPRDSLAIMDRYEITAALLSVPVPLTVPNARAAARALNEAGAEAPERFGLLATLPLPDIDGALDELAYALDTLNADGVMLLSNYAGVYLGDPRLEPVFAELDRRGTVVFVHPAAASSPVASLVPSLRDRIVDRGPILARVRESPPPAPEELARMLEAGLADSRRQLQRLFYDVTLSANDTVLDCLHAHVPSSQIVFGTDYPFAQEIGVTSTLAGLRGYRGFDEPDRRAIDADTAARLFPRLA
jgi:predicted TIM-barrel fold metal-dependent hydrolase